MKNDELDAATIERCAQVAERWLESSWRDEVFAANSIASSIRSLIPNPYGDVSGSHPRGEAEPVVKQVPSPAGTASKEELTSFFSELGSPISDADAERLALADQEENIAKTIHSTRQKLGFGGSALWEHEPPQIKTLHRETAKAVIDSLRAGGWREDMENAPHGQCVLLGWHDWRDGAWCMEVGCASHGRRTYAGSSVSLHGSATYWMPLPRKPGAHQ